MFNANIPVKLVFDYVDKPNNKLIYWITYTPVWPMKLRDTSYVVNNTR
jgi:hypothetical protein